MKHQHATSYRLVIGIGVLLLMGTGWTACRKAQQKAEQYGKRALRGLSDAERLAIENDLRVIADAIERYYGEQDRIPAGDMNALMSELVPAYLSRSIRSTQGYTIYYQSDGRHYVIGVPGPDGVKGTADDITIEGP